MQVITSKDNERIKDIKKLKTAKSRKQQRQFIIEGVRIVEDALNEGADIDTVVLCEDYIRHGSISPVLMQKIELHDCIYVTKGVFDSVTDVVNPQGVLAVINRKPDAESIDFNEDFIVILDSLQDPGNLGTILRTVDSVGLKQIIVSDTTADVFNPKVIRSTMGAAFRIKVIESSDLVATITTLQKHDFNVLATSLGGTKTLYDFDLKKTAIVIGNEGNGVSPAVLDAVNEKMIIPMLGKTESLNASVATGVVLYEYVRQHLQSIKKH